MLFIKLRQSQESWDISGASKAGLEEAAKASRRRSWVTWELRSKEQVGTGKRERGQEFEGSQPCQVGKQERTCDNRNLTVPVRSSLSVTLSIRGLGKCTGEISNPDLVGSILQPPVRCVQSAALMGHGAVQFLDHSGAIWASGSGFGICILGGSGRHELRGAAGTTCFSRGLGFRRLRKGRRNEQGRTKEKDSGKGMKPLSH